MIFERLQLWMDPLPRSGPEAMAVDEWLLGVARLPVLRVYRWRGNWCSVGYFGCLETAKAGFPGVEWVRRMTGGGVVDHRADWTYSLIIPKSESAALWKGAESYQRIHQLLAEALRNEGMTVHMSDGDEESGHALCFQNPVHHDLMDGHGGKLAGAGQRRTRESLLHQGSVASPCDEARSLTRAENFSALLAGSRKNADFEPPEEVIGKMISSRYACPVWLGRR